MSSPSWLLAAVLVCFHGTYVDGSCSITADCMSLKSNEQILQCIRQCRSVQDSSSYETHAPAQQQTNEEEEESLSLSLLLSALSVDPTGEQLHGEDRRSYSMEHFRWGKPMGRKRRPVKVFPYSALEAEAGPGAEPEGSTEAARVARGQDAAVGVPQRNNNAKGNGRYRMTHFRWNSPPDKRYGGFMGSYSEQSRKPLLTLIRHVIGKDGQQSRN